MRPQCAYLFLQGKNTTIAPALTAELLQEVLTLTLFINTNNKVYRTADGLRTLQIGAGYKLRVIIPVEQVAADRQFLIAFGGL